ncbi:MAG TPA: hypothetical protein VGV69_11300 [Solirubrobacterales bacterium]|nr:hypothetical protein [Solirubrobacterales bacterium]
MVDSPRRLLALVAGLPTEAAIWRQEQSAWGQQDELLATCIEVVDSWGRQLLSALVAVHGGKLQGSSEPLRIRHPDRPEPEKPAAEPATDPAQIAAFLRPIKH